MVRRMKAAIAALPFEHPDLAVTALVDGGNDWAVRIERARLRSAAKAVLTSTRCPGRSQLGLAAWNG
jgi:hypothetical protein